MAPHTQATFKSPALLGLKGTGFGFEKGNIFAAKEKILLVRPWGDYCQTLLGSLESRKKRKLLVEI